MMKKFTLGMLSLGMMAIGAFAASEASDNAGNTPYADGWNTGDNGGTGFNAWSLTTVNANQATGGFFIGDSAGNGGVGNIGTTAWGMYANSGDQALATRTFVSGGANMLATLGANQQFTIQMDNGNIDAGSSVGFNLLNSDGADRFTFEFRGGGNNYVYNLGDGMPIDTGVPYTVNGLTVALKIGASNSFTLTITPTGGTATVLTGTLAASDVDRIQMFNNNAGGGGASDLFFNNMAVSTVSAPLAISGAVSRKNHNGTDFDVNLPLTGTPGIEPRLGGATNDYTIVATFNATISSVNGTPQAEVISGTGMVGSGGVSNGGMVSISGSTITIPLTGVASQQTIQVRLNNVNGTTNVTIPMSVLVGDVTGEGNVNSADLTVTRSRSGVAADLATFRSDFNLDGVTNAADATVVRARSGQFVP